MIQCNKCKKIIIAGNTKDGLPNGVGFELSDGTIINLCQDCIINLGQMSVEEKLKFFDDLGI